MAKAKRTRKFTVTRARAVQRAEEDATMDDKSLVDILFDEKGKVTLALFKCEDAKAALASVVTGQRSALDIVQAERDSARRFSAAWKSAATRHRKIWRRIKSLDLHVEDGKMTMEMRADMVRLIALWLAEWFIETGGKNYVEMSIGGSPIGELVVTVQKVLGGKTPHQLKVEAEGERDRYKAVLLEVAADDDPRDGCAHSAAAKAALHPEPPNDQP